MTKNIAILLSAAIFAIASGLFINFINELPVTSEMAQYEKELEALEAINERGLSDAEFDRLQSLSDEFVSSMERSNFGSKNFLLDFLVTPCLVVLIGYVWFRFGRLICDSPAFVVYGSILLCSVLLILFGYFYQPVIHILSLALGLFGKKLLGQWGQSH